MLRPSKPKANLISGAEHEPKLAAALLLVLVVLVFDPGPEFEPAPDLEPDFPPALPVALCFAADEVVAIEVAMFAAVFAAEVAATEVVAADEAAQESCGAASVLDARPTTTKAVKNDFENILFLVGSFFLNGTITLHSALTAKAGKSRMYERRVVLDELRERHQGV